MRLLWMLPWLAALLLSMAPGGEPAEEAKPAPLGGLERQVTVRPKPIDEVLNNPFIGFVPSANYGTFPVPHSLAYKVATWRELEPEPGRFAFEQFERTARMDEHAANGVRLVIRVVLDYGTSVSDLDLPDWLYEEIDGDGVWYDEEVGKGFSPNYENETLIRYHERLIRALGERYDEDPRVAFIALGSLGHWGEWHTYSDDTINIPFPPMAVSDRYVEHYIESFPNKLLLMRRPYPIADEQGIGLYNDVFGTPKSTYDYIDWFESGYRSVLADAFIPAMPDFWKRGPSGGEFGFAGVDAGYFEDDRIEETLDMARRSHLSWVGPSTDIEELDESERSNMNRFLNAIGYRFAVQSVTFPMIWKAGAEANVSIEVSNEGVAPFYYRWPVELALVDDQGRIAFRKNISQDVRDWLPGRTGFEERLALPAQLPTGAYKLTIAIIDPDTGKPGVDWAMEGRRADGRYTLSTVPVVGMPDRADEP